MKENKAYATAVALNQLGFARIASKMNRAAQSSTEAVLNVPNVISEQRHASLVDGKDRKVIGRNGTGVL